MGRNFLSTIAAGALLLTAATRDANASPPAAGPLRPPHPIRQGVPEDEVRIEWLGTTYRIGGKIPITVSTRNEAVAKTLSPSGLVVKTSDGREHRLRSTATGGAPTQDSGLWSLALDAGETNETPPAGRFEVHYEYAEGERTKPLAGVLVKPVAQPLSMLEKEPSKAAVLLETSLGPILVGLRPDKAPETVKNFVRLASEGFYDGKIFHRIVRGFMAQGGAHRPDGTIATSPTIRGEFSDLSHERGTISMARGPDRNSATCQFFICFANHREVLDREYAAFGKLIAGFEALDRMALAPVMAGPDNEMSKPLEPPVILKATVVERP